MQRHLRPPPFLRTPNQAAFSSTTPTAGLPVHVRQRRREAPSGEHHVAEMAIEQRLAIDDILAMGLNFSVTCAEDLPYITEQMIRENTPGTFLGDYRIRQQKAVCQLWPRGKVPADVHELVRSDVPVLLISGERDPVTPPEMAEQAALSDEQPALGRAARRPRRGGDCIENLIRDFIDRASVQGLDTSCVADINGPVTFTLP
jgi:pimeloyl-ACP methyl ester carboxylesterase